MRRGLVLVLAAGGAVLLGAGCAQAAAVQAAGLWGRAITVPGLGALNTGRYAGVLSVSCASPGSCAAGGFYKNHGIQGFVASENKGLWGRAITVPGLGALNTGRNAGVLSVSCPSPGSCAAGGFYRNHGIQGFVVSEVNSVWRRAVEVPGLGALNKGRYAKVLSVSCASAGDCAAGGYYGNHGGAVTSGRGFVAVERNGRWRQAIKVPGLAALNKGGNAEVSSVSCASPGGCAAVGFYRDGNGHQQGFAAVEKNGVWGAAVEVPGLEALNKGGNAGVSSVSCASPGNCAAGGDYTTDASGSAQSFVVSETNGVWGTAQEVAGNLNLGRTSYAGVNSVSCASAGNCAAGGQYADSEGVQAFVVSEVNGTWAAARQVADRLNIGGVAQVTSVSCASAGNCSAGGTYDYGGYNAAFVVSEKNGVWGRGIDVPGLRRVARDAYLHSVSCASAGNCAAGGDYDLGLFVVSQKNGVWGKEIPLTGPRNLHSGTVSSVSCASARSCVAGGSYPANVGHGFGPQGFVTE